MPKSTTDVGGDKSAGTLSTTTGSGTSNADQQHLVTGGGGTNTPTLDMVAGGTDDVRHANDTGTVVADTLSKLRPGEAVWALDTSTTTSNMASDFYFVPGRLYEATLSVGAFRGLANPTGPSFLDAIQASDRSSESNDYLEVNGTNLDGKGLQDLTFALRGGDQIKVQAANNGMLNLARLASAFLTESAKCPASRGQPELPTDLALVCRVEFGNTTEGADEDSRHENSMSTTPPDYQVRWGNTANVLTGALVSGLGFSMDKSDLFLPQYGNSQTGTDYDPAQILASVGSVAGYAEQRVNGLWLEGPGVHTHVLTPLAGLREAIVQAIQKHAIEENANLGTEYDPIPFPQDPEAAADVSPSQIDRSQESARNQGDTLIPIAADIGQRLVLDPILKQIAVNLPQAVDPAFQTLADVAVGQWKSALSRQFGAIEWNTWWDYHFQRMNWGPKRDGGQTQQSLGGSAEGLVVNHARLKRH